MPTFNVNVPTQIDNDLTASTTQGASKTAINTGLSAVQSAAASDATTKANAALVSANSYTDTGLATKQPLDSDLTAIAALTPSNDDVIQRKAGAWVNRTIAQLWADLKGSADALYVSLDGSYTDPSWITSLAWAKITGKASYSPFGFSATITHTGTTAETIVYSSSPNLVGILLANDYFEFGNIVMASNDANVKQIRWYISDAQASLSNQVLIGRVSITTNANNPIKINRMLQMKSTLATNKYMNNAVTAPLSLFTAQPITDSGTIDFSGSAKYLVMTVELANSANTVNIYNGESIIKRS